MQITYFHRNPQDGFSIQKVSETFIAEIKKVAEVEEFFVPHKGSLHPIATLKNIFFIFKHRNKTGINHITGDIHFCILALLGCKSVLTVHDTYSVAISKNPIKQFIRNQLYYKCCVRIATQVVCISEKTKQDLQKSIKQKDIKVVYNAVSPLFKFGSKTFNKQRPIILQIGTSGNKNLHNIIKAITGVTCELRIIGHLDKNIISLLKHYNITFTNKLNLSDVEIVKEYENCDIVCFCSTQEGFGMPVIEGNAVGRCVISSSISPITEIAADAACLVNPNDIESIKKGLAKIIDDTDYRNKLIENGKKNIKRFQAKDIATQYDQIYNDLMK